MAENEAIKSLKNNNELCLDNCEGECGSYKDGKCYCADALVVSALEEYIAIGTVEECRAAVEKQRGKKPIILSEQSAESEGKLYIAKHFKCPTCGKTSTYFGGLPNNCHNCGQSLESDNP